MTVIEKQYMDSVINIWEQRRYEIALAIYMKRREHILSSREEDAKGAVEEANLLIAELKKTQEKK